MSLLIISPLIETPPLTTIDFRRHLRPFFIDPITGKPSPNKKYYDIVTYLVTQFTFSFTTVPFLILSFSGSLLAWSRVYLYAVVWTVSTLAFFNSPGKAMLTKQLEKRQGKASARLVRTISTESLTGKEPILGISKDPEYDISEAVKEIRAEVEARQNKIQQEKKKA